MFIDYLSFTLRMMELVELHITTDVTRKNTSNEDQAGDYVFVGNRRWANSTYNMILQTTNHTVVTEEIINEIK